MVLLSLAFVLPYRSIPEVRAAGSDESLLFLPISVPGKGGGADYSGVFSERGKTYLYGLFFQGPDMLVKEILYAVQ